MLVERCTAWLAGVQVLRDDALMRNPDPFDELLRSLEENLRRGERTPEEEPPDEPPPPRGRPGGYPPRRPSWRALWWVIPIALVFLGGRIVGFLADWTWFGSVGYSAVFWTRIWAQVLLFAAGALLFFVFFAANVVLAPSAHAVVADGNARARKVLNGGLNRSPDLNFTGPGHGGAARGCMADVAKREVCTELRPLLAGLDRTQWQQPTVNGGQFVGEAPAACQKPGCGHGHFHRFDAHTPGLKRGATKQLRQ